MLGNPATVLGDEAENGLRPAFWRRLVAFVIDISLVLFLTTLIASAWLATALYTNSAAVEAQSIEMAFGRLMLTMAIVGGSPVIVGLSYLAFSWSALSGRRSLGMRAMSLRVVAD